MKIFSEKFKNKFLMETSLKTNQQINNELKHQAKIKPFFDTRTCHHVVIFPYTCGWTFFVRHPKNHSSRAKHL